MSRSAYHISNSDIWILNLFNKWYTLRVKKVEILLFLRQSGLSKTFNSI